MTSDDFLSRLLTATVIVAAAFTAFLALRRLRRRLPLFLTRKAMGGRATHPDPVFQHAIDLIVLPATLAIWLLAAWAVSNRLPALHFARDAAVAAVTMASTMALFELQGRPYSLFDLLALPALLGLLWIAVGACTRLIQSKVLGAAGVERGAQETVGTLFRLAATALGSLVILQAWGVDVRSLALAAGVLGVGIGFGLQHLANNLVSGVVIGLERPVKPGDFVTIGELQGTVERIGARSVEIVTRDHVSILVPNSHFLEQQVVNWSHRDTMCRLHVPVGVAYGSSIRMVRTALLEAAARHPEVLTDPRPTVEFRSFGDNALLFELEVWTKAPSQQQQLVSDLNYRIEAALRRHGLSVPFPQRELHLRSPDLSAIALAFARRHLGDEELAAARATLEAADRRDEEDDFAAIDERRTWDDDQLDAVVARLRGDAGLEIADRRHLLTLYRRCFVGREAVDWLVRHEGLTRSEAVRLGQLLVKRDVLHHVLDEHPFQDADLFYRFLADEADRGEVAAPASAHGVDLRARPPRESGP